MVVEIIKAIIFGIVEGITEWLPVSSTGHLILVGNVLKPSMSDAFMEMFDVVIQLGAIMAVVVLYFHKLNPFSPRKSHKQKMLIKTLQASLKTAQASHKRAQVTLLANQAHQAPNNCHRWARYRFQRPMQEEKVTFHSSKKSCSFTSL